MSIWKPPVLVGHIGGGAGGGLQLKPLCNPYADERCKWNLHLKATCAGWPHWWWDWRCLFPCIWGFWGKLWWFIPYMHFFFFFKVEIIWHTKIPLFRLGSFHSGSVSWDDCGWGKATSEVSQGSMLMAGFYCPRKYWMEMWSVWPLPQVHSERELW